MVNKNIVFLGFSFTGFGDSTSYGELLKNKLLNNGWDNFNVKEISFGGLSINALSGLTEQILNDINDGDVVCLELSTSFFSLHGYSTDDALTYLQFILKSLSKRKIFLFFLNLFRYDLADDDCVVKAINHLSNLHNINILDLKAKFRQIYSKDKSLVTSDGVHPDSAGRDLIADFLNDFILDTEYSYTSLKDVKCDINFRYLNFLDLNKSFPVYQYSGRGKSIAALELPHSSKINITFNEPLNIEGFYFLYGPETGYVVFESSDGEIFELITYDEHSYYRRIGFRVLKSKTSSFTITSLDKRRDIKLAKETSLSFSTRKDYLCGMLISY